jgi:hypothetical protein
MKRAILGIVLALTIAVPVSAAPPAPATATITVSPASPAYGDHITLSVTATATPSDVTMVCTHEFGQSFSFSPTSYSTTYSDDVGLYAPNWPSGGASCLAEVRLYTTRGHHYRTDVIGSLAFTVSP